MTQGIKFVLQLANKPIYDQRTLQIELRNTSRAYAKVRLNMDGILLYVVLYLFYRYIVYVHTMYVVRFVGATILHGGVTLKRISPHIIIAKTILKMGAVFKNQTQYSRLAVASCTVTTQSIKH